MSDKYENLGNLLEPKGYIRGPFGSALKRNELLNSGIPVYEQQHAITGIRSFRYFINENKFNELKRFTVKNNDLIISCSGTVGKISIIKETDPKGIISQALLILRFDQNKVLPLYMYYFLTSKEGQKEILNASQGAVQLNIAPKNIVEKINVPIYSLETQQKIVDKLQTIDNKIQLNTQINQTLEQIAQALFKSWFVDFDPVLAKVQALSDGLSLEQAELAAMQAISGKTPEELTALSQAQPDRYAELAKTAKAFPCEMVEVDGGEVPKGWELSTIGDCYDVVMGQSPKGETYNENKQGMLFYQGRAEFGWRFPTPRLFTTDPKRIAEQNSILMSVRAPVGDINIALEKCCIGRGLAALQHKSKSLSFGLYQIQSIKPELDLFNGEGTVFGSINQANLKNIQIINPDEKFIQLFEKYLSSCDSKIMNNEIENNALKEIRDLLLPRLLSGEIQL